MSERARRDCARRSAPCTRGHPGGTNRSTTTTWHARSPPRPALTSCRLRRSARPVNFVSRGKGADGRPSKQLRRKRIGAEEREERAGRKRSQCQVVVESRCPVEAVTEAILAQGTHWAAHLRKPFLLWARTPRGAEAEVLSVGPAARDACRAPRSLLGAKNAVSRHRARPTRGGMPIARQRADAARRGQNMEHASSAARSLSGGARPRSSGRPITSAARSPLRRAATRLRPLASARGLAAKCPGVPPASDYADGAKSLHFREDVWKTCVKLRVLQRLRGRREIKQK